MRPFTGLPKFFCSPCEIAPVPARKPNPVWRKHFDRGERTPLELVRQLVAERTELPLSAIQPGQRLLSDLHLNSITVAQLVAEAARRCGLPPPVSALRFADGTLSEVASMLETAPAAVPEQTPAGVDSWIRTFTVDLAPHRSLKGGRTARQRQNSWRPLSVAVVHSARLPARGRGGPAVHRGVLLCLPPSRRTRRTFR